jgi:hypothetical protein
MRTRLDSLHPALRRARTPSNPVLARQDYHKPKTDKNGRSGVLMSWLSVKEPTQTLQSQVFLRSCADPDRACERRE